MESLILEALQDFSKFKELAETIPCNVLAGETSRLTKKQQEIFNEYRERLTAPKKVEEFQVGDIVKFVNPDNLVGSKIYEILELKVVRVNPYIIWCELPEGALKTFGVSTLCKISPNSA